MPFLESLLVFGLAPLICFGLFVVLMVAGVSLDRNEYSEQPKWYIFFFGLVALVAFLYKGQQGNIDGVVNTVMNTVFSSAFWWPVLIYLALGVAYSLVEAFMTIRKAERKIAAEWESSITQQVWVDEDDAEKLAEYEADQGNALTSLVRRSRSLPQKSVTIRSILAKAPQDRTESEKEKARHFLSTVRRENKGFIQYEASTEDTAITPVINKAQLASYIGAWTFFWPFYLISMLIGDLFVELFRMLADLFAKIFGGMVKSQFKDTFKV